MDYNGDSSWVMSFLYKNPSVGKVGETESSVIVTDRPQVTVISVALSGESDLNVVDRGV